jgi:hypothetical protein
MTTKKSGDPIDEPSRTSDTINPEVVVLIRLQGATYIRVGSQEQLRDQKAAIYARSATGNQAALTAQIDQCKAYAEEMGDVIDDLHIYQDSGSGLVNPCHHEDFPRLLAAAQRHEFNLLLLVCLDRLSRNTVAVQEALEVLEQYGIKVIALNC